MTTNLFAGGIFAAYGFTGTLPPLALERLTNKPMWIFHSQDDVIFPVKCSDRLVHDLRLANTNSRNSGSNSSSNGGGNDGGNNGIHGEQQQQQDEEMIRYTRFDKDPEGFTGSVRGHSTGITASRDENVYKWLLDLPPLVKK